jgi:hypothetical protein
LLQQDVRRQAPLDRIGGSVETLLAEFEQSYP